MNYQLILVEKNSLVHQAFLYKLLAERPREANISHKTMPTLDEHVMFVKNHPYDAWYIIQDLNDCEYIGATYLQHNEIARGHEIGVFVLRAFQGKGIGRWAVKELMEQHGKLRYLANIAPFNTRSFNMFRGLGFDRIQVTMELDKTNG
jgi:RimJ/RimL family protein N-acetyltransferase